MIIRGMHDEYLVVLSVVIAVFASFTALSLANRIRASTGWVRRLWLGAAACALGGGIWSMHFVAMLAFSIPGMAMTYDWLLTFLSLAVALLFTGAGFAVMRWADFAATRLFGAGLLMGLGVVAMHYLGMAAMHMPATLSYQRGWVAISVLIAIGAATAALWLAARDKTWSYRLVAAAIMGVAIAGMHYAGMRAAIFTASPSTDMATGTATVGQTNLAIVVSAVTLAILLLGLGAARLEQLFRAYARREAQTALRLEIADILRAPDTDKALAQIAELMGQFFDVSRTGYGQLDPEDDVFDYTVCWTDGIVQPLLGRMPAAAFGVKIVAALSAGQTVAIEDLLVDPLGSDVRKQATMRDVGTRAILVVPFVRAGKLTTIVYLNDRRPRRWSRKDIAFMEEIAERTRLVVERAEVEERLREFNALLEARVEKRTQELREAQEALLQSQKMEAVGQLVSGLAHDFNNVLAAVLGAFDLISRRAQDHERVLDLARSGREAAERGAKLTGQLLAFARAHSIQSLPILLCDIIEDMRDMLARVIGPMIKLEFNLNQAPVPVLADPTQVEMMILNLAINARDAMPDGGTLCIATSVRQIVSDPELADDDYVELKVQDTGTGMDAATLRRAMEPFFTTKPVGKGTGLGLAQIYGSARQAGGTVRIESAPGRGTTVRVLLPCTDRPPVALPESTSGTARAPLAPARIVLVDDDDKVRHMIADALRMEGHAVREAENGKRALDLIAAETPDAAVLDFAMPDMNGAELARRIGSQWPSLPIVFASGFADPDAIDAAVGGTAIILRKPFKIEELVRALERALKR